MRLKEWHKNTTTHLNGSLGPIDHFKHNLRSRQGWSVFYEGGYQRENMFRGAEYCSIILNTRIVADTLFTCLVLSNEN